MDKRICDMCNTKEASKSYKINCSSKKRMRTAGDGARGIIFDWSPYEKVDICEECADKLLGIVRRPP